MDRAFVFGTKGRRFESVRGYHDGNAILILMKTTDKVAVVLGIAGVLIAILAIIILSVKS